MQPERVSWAWETRLPLAMLSLLVGLGGLAKSTLAIYIAAKLSRGTLPGDLFGKPVTVAIATAEDHRAAVVVPRLIAAGADLDRIVFPELVGDDDAISDIALDGDAQELEDGLSAQGVRALIIDTVVAFMPSAHDSHKEQHVRAVLTPLAHMAERGNIAVLGIMHLNRREARDVLTRINGSGAFGNLARSVLVFAPDPDSPEGPTRILAVGKTNVGVKPPALRMRIETSLIPAEDGTTIEAPRIEPVEDTAHTARELLGAGEDEEERSVMDDAVTFLSELLANGAIVESKVVHQGAAEVGVSGMLRRAQRRLGIKPQKVGMKGPWMWALPPKEERPAEDEHDEPKVNVAEPRTPSPNDVHLQDGDGEDGAAY